MSFSAETIAPGERLVVVASSDLAAFTTAWGLNPVSFTAWRSAVRAWVGATPWRCSTPVGVSRPGSVTVQLVTAADGTVVTPAAPGTGVTPTDGVHAGAVFGGAAIGSAVWDGVLSSTPTYRAAVTGCVWAGSRSRLRLRPSGRPE